MELADFSAYARVVVNGEEYVVIMELPAQKIMAVRASDIGGGAESVPLYIINKQS